MKTAFSIWETNRKLHSEYLEKYSLEQLNTIPQGFHNNLIWNIGHIIVAQQGLIYKASDLPGYVSDAMFGLYKPGTFPTGKTQQSDVDELKELLMSLIEKTKRDYSNHAFDAFKASNTTIGFNLDSVETAIAFNNYHEALHLGFMMSIKKFL